MWRERLTRRFPALELLPPRSYVVGGAVRDLLMGRDPADVDIATIDPLAAARAVSHRVITLGNQEHLRAYRVVDGGHVYDFAELLDHDLDADLARRDFTVNAMAVDLEADSLVDPHGGQRDIEARVVRMVDETNFDDDPLRTIKAIRMAVKFDFTIDDDTLAAIRRRASRITDVAVERVTFELTVILSANRFREAVRLFRATSLDVPLFGRELHDAFHDDDVPPTAAFALLVGDPRAHAERWRWSDALLRDVLTVQRLLSSSGDLRVALYDAGEEVARAYVAALRALGLDANVELPDFTIKPLLSGAEIAALTALPPGKELGALKRALLEAQVRGEVRTAEEAETYVTREVSSRAMTRRDVTAPD